MQLWQIAYWFCAAILVVGASANVAIAAEMISMGSPPEVAAALGGSFLGGAGLVCLWQARDD